LLSFIHEDFRLAVQSKYVQNDEKLKTMHERLASYFAGLELSVRAIDELPYHYLQSKNIIGLIDCLTKVSVFKLLSIGANVFDLFAYWREIGSIQNMVDHYLKMVEKYEEDTNNTPEDKFALFSEVANFFKLAGAYEAAFHLFEKVLTIQKSCYTEKNMKIAFTLQALGELCYHRGKYDQSEQYLLESVDTFKTLNSIEIPYEIEIASVLNNLAMLYGKQAKYSECEPLYTQILPIYEKKYGNVHPNIAYVLHNLGGVQQSLAHYEEAEKLYLRALDIKQKALGAMHPECAATLLKLGLLYKLTGKYSDAESFCKKALEIRESTLGLEHPTIAVTLGNLAGVYSKQKKYDEAESLYKRAIEIQKKLSKLKITQKLL